MTPEELQAENRELRDENERLREILADPNNLHTYLLRNHPGWEVWRTERVRGMQDELRAATEAANDERINNTMTLPEWCAEVAQKNERLLVALRDAIDKPKGVVPDSALEFYESTKGTK